MNIENEQHHGRWLRMLMLFLIIVPILSGVSVLGTALVHPQAAIVAKADDDNNLENDATDNSNEPTNNQKSAWNEASATLSSTPHTGQITVDSMEKVNAWGFMDNANTDIWSKSNNSSWAMSYQAVLNKKSKIPKDALINYQRATTFAFAMQATGLDQPTKSGFSTISPMQTGFGWMLQASYYVLRFANAMFDVILSVLQDINPLHWIVQYSQQHSTTSTHLSSNQGDMTKADAGTPTDALGNNSGVTNFSNFIVTYYSWFTNWGWAIMALFLAGGLGMAALGINISQSGGFVGQYRSLISTFASFFKRLFVFIMVPIISASLYDMAVGQLQGSFSSDNGSITDYAVYGAFVDYGDWVTHSRLQLPAGGMLSGGGIKADLANGTTSTLTHRDIVAINYVGAGQDVSDLYYGLSGGKYATDSSAELSANSGDLSPEITNSLQGFQYDSKQNSGNDGQDESAIDLLNSWTNGSTMTAADYASIETPPLIKGDNASNLATKLATSTYNTNGRNDVSGSLVTGGNGGTPNDADAGPNDDGGLSTLGQYTYMLTTANDNGLTIADTENLSNDVALPQHYTVNLVGTGMLSTGNAVWALGMMGGLAIIVLGYAWEILKSILQGIPAMTFATFQTAFGSLKGGVQLISVVVGMLLGTLGSAFLYHFAQVAFIDLAQFSDSVIQKGIQSAVSLNLFSAHGNRVGGLAATSGVTANTIAGAANLLYGGFLLFLAIMLLRYRSIIISSLAMTVEETFNKILASFGSALGTGSAGTRGAISQNTNTGNTWGDNASSVIQSGGMAALMGGGALGGISALGKGSGKGTGTGKGVGAGKGKGMNGNNNSNKLSNANSSKHANTSANKTGNAAQSTGTGKNNGNGNAASALGKQNAESQGNTLGKEGQGINANAHSPAGQGAQNGQGQNGRGQNGQGTDGQSQNGQNAKANQGQGTKQNAGVGNGAEISGNGLNTNDGDITQQNGDMTSIGGDNAQTNGQESDSTSQSKLGQQSSHKNNGMSNSNRESNLQNANRDQSAMDGGLNGQGQDATGQNGQQQAGQLGKTALAAGAGAMAGNLANGKQANNNTNDNTNDTDNDDSSIGADNGDSQLAQAAGATTGQALADASGMNGDSSSNNNSSVTRTKTSTTTGTNDTNDAGNSDLGQQDGSQSIGMTGGNQATNDAGATDQNDSTIGDAGSNQLAGGLGQTQNGTSTNGQSSSIGTGTNTQSQTETNEQQEQNVTSTLGDASNNQLQGGLGQTNDAGSTLGTVSGNQISNGLGANQAQVTGTDAGVNATGDAGGGMTLGAGDGSSTLANVGGNQVSSGLSGNGQSQLVDAGSDTLANAGGGNESVTTGGNSPLNAVDNGGGGSTLANAGGTNGLDASTGGGSTIANAGGGGTVSTTGGESSTLAAVDNGVGGSTLSNQGGAVQSSIGGGGSPSIVQSQMGDVQSALTDAQQAQTLAQQSPDNSVLQQRAQQASNTLSSVQGQAVDAYNSQPVGNNALQAGWMNADAGGGGGSSMTVGDANSAMNGVYQAQQGYTNAQQQYGANSPQAQGAKDQLVSAQQSAVQAGLSSDVVSNPQQVEEAHSSIMQANNSLKDGTWQPDSPSVSGGLSQGSPSNKGTQRSIGI